jgi:hypothetical protein
MVNDHANYLFLNLFLNMRKKYIQDGTSRYMNDLPNALSDHNGAKKSC